MQDILRDILVTHTGQPLDQISRDTDRDFYLTAEGAVEYGLVDEILKKPESK
jgi:ATP-dependent Clp protease protease subunit